MWSKLSAEEFKGLEFASVVEISKSNLTVNYPTPDMEAGDK